MRFVFFVFFASLFFVVKAQEIQEKVMVKNIVTTGNKQTKHRIILRELPVKTGDTIAATAIPDLQLLIRQRLANTGLFNEITVVPDTISDAEINWNIHVKERWYIWPEVSVKLADWNFNVWWDEMNHDLRRVNLSVNITHNNFRGTTDKLSVGGQIGYTRKLSLSYTRPYVDKSQKHGFGVSFNYGENEETSYKTDSNKLLFARLPNRPILRVADGYLSYFFRPGYDTKHIFRIGYRDLKVADTFLKLNNDYYQNSSTKMRMIDLSYRIEKNHTDNWIYPLRGYKTNLTATALYGLEGFDFLAQLYLEHGVYKQLAKKWFFSSIFRGRLMVPQALPYALRGGLGRDYDYVRGYEYYVVDGYQFGLVRFSLKRELLNSLNVLHLPFRYLPNIPLRLYPKIFTDAGYITNPQPGNSFLNSRLLYSVGAGVDIVTIYDIKLRVEYTINHLGQKGLFLHFTSE